MIFSYLFFTHFYVRRAIYFDNNVSDKYITGLIDNIMENSNNIFAYMRISTQEERKKQKYTRQEWALEKYAKEHNIEYLLTFKEDVSGKNFIDRKQWNSLERFSFDNYDDALLAIDAIRFLQQGITYDVKGKEKKINQECNLYNLDEIIFGLKNRKETEQLRNELFNIFQ